MGNILGAYAAQAHKGGGGYGGGAMGGKVSPNYGLGGSLANIFNGPGNGSTPLLGDSPFARLDQSPGPTQNIGGGLYHPQPKPPSGGGGSYFNPYPNTPYDPARGGTIYDANGNQRYWAPGNPLPAGWSTTAGGPSAGGGVTTTPRPVTGMPWRDPNPKQGQDDGSWDGGGVTATPRPVPRDQSPMPGLDVGSWGDQSNPAGAGFTSGGQTATPKTTTPNPTGGTTYTKKPKGGGGGFHQPDNPIGFDGWKDFY
jgi:hypothetical protein